MKDRWTIVSADGSVISGTESRSKGEATRALEGRMLAVIGISKPWDYWKKRGFKIRRAKKGAV